MFPYFKHKFVETAIIFLKGPNQEILIFSGREYLDISLDLQMKRSPHWEQRMRFWDSLYLA
jgi:hypothetical protein